MPSDFRIIRDAYTVWYDKVAEACEEFVRVCDADESGGEDLGDFADALGTLLTFGPNPRSFPKEV